MFNYFGDTINTCMDDKMYLMAGWNTISLVTLLQLSLNSTKQLMWLCFYTYDIC